MCSLSLLHFRENTWRSPSTSRETPTVALSIAVSQSARSFLPRDRRNKFPIFLPFFSLFHPLLLFVPLLPTSVLLEKVSGACFDRGSDLVCRSFTPHTLPTISTKSVGSFTQLWVTHNLAYHPQVTSQPIPVAVPRDEVPERRAQLSHFLPTPARRRPAVAE